MYRILVLLLIFTLSLYHNLNSQCIVSSDKPFYVQTEPKVFIEDDIHVVNVSLESDEFSNVLLKFYVLPKMEEEFLQLPQRIIFVLTDGYELDFNNLRIATTDTLEVANVKHENVMTIQTILDESEIDELNYEAVQTVRFEYNTKTAEISIDEKSELIFQNFLSCIKTSFQNYKDFLPPQEKEFFAFKRQSKYHQHIEEFMVGSVKKFEKKVKVVYMNFDENIKLDSMKNYSLPFIIDCNSKTAEKDNCTDDIISEYFEANFIYPRIAKENGIEGIVIIECLLSKEGVLTPHIIKREIGAACASAVFNLLYTMRDELKWSPPIKSGEPLTSSISIAFQLQISD